MSQLEFSALIKLVSENAGSHQPYIVGSACRGAAFEIRQAAGIRWSALPQTEPLRLAAAQRCCWLRSSCKRSPHGSAAAHQPLPVVCGPARASKEAGCGAKGRSITPPIAGPSARSPEPLAARLLASWPAAHTPAETAGVRAQCGRQLGRGRKLAQRPSPVAKEAACRRAGLAAHDNLVDGLQDWQQGAGA